MEHLALLCFAQQATGVLGQQEALSHGFLSGRLHRSHIAFVGLIAFFQRQPRVPRGPAFLGSSGKWNEAACIVADLAGVKGLAPTRGDVPPQISAQGRLQEDNRHATELIAICIDFGGKHGQDLFDRRGDLRDLPRGIVHIEARPPVIVNDW